MSELNQAIYEAVRAARGRTVTLAFSSQRQAPAAPAAEPGRHYSIDAGAHGGEITAAPNDAINRAIRKAAGRG